MAFHRRRAQFGERLAQLRHIDDARFAAERRAVLQLRHFERRSVELERMRGAELQSRRRLLSTTL